MEGVLDYIHTVGEERLVEYSAWSMLICGAFVFVTTLGFISAPYGRYGASAPSGILSGCKLPARASWMIMESPTLVAFVLFYYFGLIKAQSLASKILYACFVVHYIHRSLIFPFRMKAGAPMPLFVMLSALFYCSWNGLMQATYFLRVGQYDDEWLWDPRFLVGLAVFALGMAANIHSDSTLMNLRKPGETGYKIPRGGMFEYVSSANYGGEIIEWFGFALASWSLPGLAFAAFTLANTGPRGYKHHQWYLSKFEDYPKNRKAVIPFIW